jgi:signal transduction histidine kinase
VLDLAKIEAGKIEVRRTRVEVGALLEDLLATLQPVAAASRMSLHLRCAAPVVVDSDARLVRQIVLNLVSNAIKFGAPAPVTIACLAMDEGPMRVAIEVADGGPGIAPENQERIFEEYVQLQGGKHSGTGLGLAISRRLAQALGGTLAVESAIGRGTTFRLALP